MQKFSYAEVPSCVTASLGGTGNLGTNFCRAVTFSTNRSGYRRLRQRCSPHRDWRVVNSAIITASANS